MKFSEKGAGGGGQRPFGNFPEIHPFSGRQASLIEGYWGLCEGHRRFSRLLGGLRRYKGSWGVCLFNGDPRQSKKDHRGFPGVLEGAEETWGVTFEVTGGYWGFCGGNRRFGTLLFGFCVL